ncbi:MAG: TIGR03960 family B12-binding radical SAM protein [Desulfobaccales bacterium]
MPEKPYLSRVQRPSRYLGREVNVILKDPREVSLRVALLFPDLYEVGMSHLGLGILYDVLNRQPEIWCERAFAPAPDLEAELTRRGEPLGTLESGEPLRHFPLVGVSLQYELCYTNVLTLLHLGGIPLLAAERGPHDPVVVGGGPAAFNPEPLAPFFDAFLLGDGEEAVLELAKTVAAWRQARGSREELWRALEEISGVYVPAFFAPAWDEAGRLREMVPRGRRERIFRRLLDDLNRIPLSPTVLVPTCPIVHDRLSVEIVRGCSRGCRYCQAGIIYRPVRERDPEAVNTWVEAALAATGFEEVSLLALSPGDYAPLPWLLARLMDRLEGAKVSLSLPSLRADTLGPELTCQIKRVRRTGLTIAPEAGSERLRQVVNKNLSEEAILTSAREVFRQGWRLLKLYFMVGLPTETSADREELTRLVQAIRETAPEARPELHVSLSTFIPKAHTPFQWERQLGLTESRAVLAEVKERLRRRQVQVKWNSAAQSWLEGVFSRGDRRLADVLLAAWRRGCRLDAWSEHLRLDPWREAFREAGVDPEEYLRERHPGELLPWAHLDSGVTQEFLLVERERAYSGLATPDCRQAGCQDCGACEDPCRDLKLYPAPAATPEVASRPAPELHRTPPPVLYRLSYAKLGPARWLSHLELINAIYRALRRAALPLAFTGGYHPLPKVAFHGALPVGVESLCECLDVALTRPLPPEALVERLNSVLPEGLKALTAARLAPGAKAPEIAAASFEVESPLPVFAAEKAAAFLAQESVPFVKRRPGGPLREVDVRPLVATLTVPDPYHLQLTVRTPAKDNLKITEILASVFGLSADELAEVRLVKTRALPAAGPPERVTEARAGGLRAAGGRKRR